MIDKNFIEKVKSALNIVNVIETFARLHKTGANYKGVCPFHDDHSPSMVVSLQDRPITASCAEQVEM